MTDDILTPQGRFKAGAGAARWRPRLAATLEIIAAEAARLTDEWWIIGSAAAALSGAEIADVRDVDLLLGEGDARALLERWASVRNVPTDPDQKFHSAIFARFEHGPLPIEAFGGFEMKIRSRWRKVTPLTRVTRGAVFTPSVAEQIAILEAMDRDKDRLRAAALRALL